MRFEIHLKHWIGRKVVCPGELHIFLSLSLAAWHQNRTDGLLQSLVDALFGVRTKLIHISKAHFNKLSCKIERGLVTSCQLKMINRRCPNSIGGSMGNNLMSIGCKADRTCPNLIFDDFCTSCNSFNFHFNFSTLCI